MMKKTILTLFAAQLALMPMTAQNTPVSQMERLDRGVVALPRSSGSGNFVSWRMLGTDDEDRLSFDVIRNGAVVKKDLYATCYEDAGGAKGSSYRIVTKVDGEAVDTTEAVSAWELVYNPIKLDRPAKGANGGEYSPNDMSVGDVDGDGQYELFVKWDPSTSKDNSQGGVTDNVFIDCYKLDGTRLWRIDLGRNIRAGAHYTQFMVYDFDGDGRAEMMCKTGPGSLDGKGSYVNSVATEDVIKNASNTALHRNSDGRITGGQEWLTVFGGLTGEAIHTIFYNPNRNMNYGGAADGSQNWGDVDGKNDTGSYGNRGERFLAAVAYLDGPDKNPSGIFSRGYYGYAFIWAVDFDGQLLHQKWLSSHKSKTNYTLSTYDAEGKRTVQSFSKLQPTSGSGSGTMFGNGNHNLSIADVDGDGCDEIIWGSAGLNNDGTLLYGTGFGHGDAIHMADHCPDRPGLEVFEVHEEKGTYAWDLHDAATGEVLLKGGPAGEDNGRGMAGQFDAAVRGSLFWSSSDGSARSAVTGEAVSTKHGSTNFRVYWDGDLREELFDGGKIDKWNGNGTDRLYLNGKNLYDYNSSSTCNSTKSTPNLQADILGDWREEIILWSAADNATINIFTTNTATAYRMPTLMHDHTYRMGICWQNTAYNQPPHLGYYLPDAVKPRIVSSLEHRAGQQQPVSIELKWRYAKSAILLASFMPDGTRKAMTPPEDFERPVFNTADKTITVTGTPQTVGDYQLVFRLTGYGNETSTDTLVVHVMDMTGITDVTAKGHEKAAPLFDLQGRRLKAQPRRGIYIENRRKKVF